MMIDLQRAVWRSRWASTTLPSTTFLVFKASLVSLARADPLSVSYSVFCALLISLAAAAATSGFHSFTVWSCTRSYNMILLRSLFGYT